MQPDLYTGKKIESDGLPGLTIFDVKKLGLLHGSGDAAEVSWSRQGLLSKQIVLAAFIRTSLREDEAEVFINGLGEAKGISQSVRLTTTPCRYGGKRYWFLCAGGSCRHYRVGKLYLLNGEFSCRNCLNLTYHSRNVPDLKDFSILNDIFAVDQLRKKIGREMYRGKPTKKQQKLDELELKIFINSRAFRTGAKKKKRRTIPPTNNS